MTIVKDALTNTQDGLKSLIGNLGDPSRDKSASVYFADKNIDDQQLMAAFETNWIARKIVVIPVQDGVRKWRTWGGEKADAISSEEKRLKVKAKIFEAAWKGRLFGGAAIYIGTDQESSEPLNVDTIRKGGIKYLSVMTRRELTAGGLMQDPFSEYYGRPEEYAISGGTGQAYIHPSRLVLFYGDDKPDTWFSNGVDLGWSNSVLKAVHDTIAQTGGTFASVASLVFEANIDVISMPDLMSNIGSDGYESNVIKRFQLAASNKGINGTLILDKEETYERRSAVFAHLPEIMQAFAMYCAAAADIPATRFLAQSPNGMNATGDSDMANYHDKIQSMQMLTFEPAMSVLDACLVRSALGAQRDDASFTWNPLKQMDEKELAEIGEVTMKTLDLMSDYLTGEEIRALIVHKMAEMGTFPRMADVIADTDRAMGDAS